MSALNQIREKDFLEFMSLRESQFIEKPNIWLEELLNYESYQAEGDVLPWSKSHDLIQFRPGEVTLWGGINGHGKSLIVNQAILHWMASGAKAVVASLEMKPRDTLHRMLLQTGMSQNPTNADKTKFITWLTDKLWIYDQLDQVPFDRIIGMVHYAAQELGAKHIVIDSLMKCGIKDDDYNGQKEFLDHLCWAAKSDNCHIHLVVHMRKRASENDRPGKFDVYGSSAITNLVDQLVIIHRNKEKEEKGGSECDASLYVAKNRHGGTEGGIKLWFAEGFLQFNQSSKWQDMRVEI